MGSGKGQAKRTSLFMRNKPKSEEDIIAVNDYETFLKVVNTPDLNKVIKTNYFNPEDPHLKMGEVVDLVNKVTINHCRIIVLNNQEEAENFIKTFRYRETSTLAEIILDTKTLGINYVQSRRAPMLNYIIIKKDLINKTFDRNLEIAKANNLVKDNNIKKLKEMFRYQILWHEVGHTQDNTLKGRSKSYLGSEITADLYANKMMHYCFGENKVGELYHQMYVKMIFNQEKEKLGETKALKIMADATVRANQLYQNTIAQDIQN